MSYIFDCVQVAVLLVGTIVCASLVPRKPLPALIALFGFVILLGCELAFLIPKDVYIKFIDALNLSFGVGRTASYVLLVAAFGLALWEPTSSKVTQIGDIPTTIQEFEAGWPSRFRNARLAFLLMVVSNISVMVVLYTPPGPKTTAWIIGFNILVSIATVVTFFEAHRFLRGKGPAIVAVLIVIFIPWGMLFALIGLFTYSRKLRKELQLSSQASGAIVK